MIENLIAKRLGGSNFLLNPKIYRFAYLKQIKEQIEQENTAEPILDFGIGEPDEMAFAPVVEELKRQSELKKNRFYSDNGIEELKVASAQFMQSFFSVSLNSKTEVMTTMGIKAMLTMLPLGFINPGDYILTTTPGYVVMSNMTKWLGGGVYRLPLVKENNFYPDFTKIPEDIINRSKMIYLNYPNNPTGQIASKDFWKQVVDFAHDHHLIVVHDAAYLPLVFDPIDRCSLLSIPGAMEVAVELHSLSKGFNMTGWRIGFAAGNKDVITVLSTIKENMDSGQFIPIQKAAITALSHPEWIDSLVEKYKRRHELLQHVLSEAGFHSEIPKAGFYQYVKIPKRMDGEPVERAEEFSLRLLKELRIMTIPYDEDGYVRFSVTYEATSKQAETDVMSECAKRFASHTFSLEID